MLFAILREDLMFKNLNQTRGAVTDMPSLGLNSTNFKIKIK